MSPTTLVSELVDLFPESAVVSFKALIVAYAVAEAGHCEVIGLDIGEVESEAF